MHPLVAALGLAPHPEGGWFRETWRTPDTLPAHGGTRSAATAIHYLLLDGEASRWHRVRSGELWLWQGGGPLVLSLGGTGERPRYDSDVLLGPDPLAGHALQHLVEPGEWQAARPAAEAYALVACIVSPGFDAADFELA